MRYERHFFVCITNRPPMAKPSCGQHNSMELLQLLQAEVDTRELWQRIGVSGCTCLGPCESGPNIVVYPEGVWYAGVKADDIAEIVESHMLGGAPVERLRFQPPAEPPA